ncbi:Bax inhibitor-1/YccA family protein [Methylovirgula sp. 4M-Z18]|uniref:Bax inhibitor-1/YccA family protein n=1 Tax=Methylovirgula sp. 4M-Z18 TaxID=2293567 RepID=UPI000E2F7A64|nr:Bax inhibitor-1/YccA family protein [Methylovirgula sp. 4M-Z18]RFB76487.1 BAX inhibitor (BI)-1/YccA family protein [Methylovirgula sp. 4M-Z18]
MANLSTTPSQPHFSYADVGGGLHRYMLRVYGYMAGGLALSGLIAYFAAQNAFYEVIFDTPAYWIVLLAPVALVFLLTFQMSRMSVATAHICFWVYASTVGLSLAGIFVIYSTVSIAPVFFIAATTFALTSLYGHVTQRDLGGLGTYLMMGLFGVAIAGLVNLFFVSSAFQFALSIVGVVVFIGLTAWDSQRVREIYVTADEDNVTSKKAILGALALYLDFLNLFLMLMPLTGGGRRRW